MKGKEMGSIDDTNQALHDASDRLIAKQKELIENLQAINEKNEQIIALLQKQIALLRAPL